MEGELTIIDNLSGSIFHHYSSPAGCEKCHHDKQEVGSASEGVGTSFGVGGQPEGRAWADVTITVQLQGDSASASGPALELIAPGHPTRAWHCADCDTLVLSSPPAQTGPPVHGGMVSVLADLCTSDHLPVSFWRTRLAPSQPQG